MDQTPDNVNGSYSSASSVIAIDTKNMTRLSIKLTLIKEIGFGGDPIRARVTV